ncbi:hypothetical protein CEXT_807921 [Caerostris extrusa]|uniref:Uncharacterized protein n=1 Tax=Caerostris extrusa TaxID=172846 RepID=A0AAV4YB81_CAEEX|nr:hypothetical protein CEXT_807921 [Caerostris extrusa]
MHGRRLVSEQLPSIAMRSFLCDKFRFFSWRHETFGRERRRKRSPLRHFPFFIYLFVSLFFSKKTPWHSANIPLIILRTSSPLCLNAEDQEGKIVLFGNHSR